MNLVWHIARRDLRHLAWAAGVLSVFHGATLALAWIMRDELLGYDEPGKDVFWIWHYAGVVMIGVMTYFVVGMLLQEDPVANPGAFWATRPISRGRLLAAKLLAGGVLFGLLPIVLRLPWWLANGYGLREIGWAGVETTVLYGAIASLAFLLASLTDGLRQFGRATGLAVALVLACLLAIVASVDALNGSLDETRWRLLFGGGAVLCLVAAVCQVFTRRRIVALSLVGLGVPCVVGYAVAWTRVEPAAPAALKSDPVEGVALSSRIVVTPPRNAAPPINLHVGMDATQAGAFATLTSLRGVLRPATGEPIDVVVDEMKRDSAALGGVIALQGTSPRARTVIVPLALRQAQVRRLEEGPVSGRIELRGQLWHVEAVVEMPRQAGARAAQGAQRLWIRQFISIHDGLKAPVFGGMTLNETVPLLAVDGAQVTVENDGAASELGEIYLLVNRRRNEALPMLRHWMSAVRTATVGLRQVALYLQETPMSGDDLQRWLPDAVVVKVVLRRAGEFSQAVEISP